MTYRLTLLLSILLTGCASGPQENPSARVNIAEIQKQQVQNKDKLFLFYERWHSTPYRLGGQSLTGVDCSAFVQIAYDQIFSQSLPRTTNMQSNVGESVDYEDRAFGDLVFFKTGIKVRHVGIYIGDNSFMHASTSRGVIISRLDSPYWADVYWQTRRVL